MQQAEQAVVVVGLQRWHLLVPPAVAKRPHACLLLLPQAIAVVQACPCALWHAALQQEAGVAKLTAQAERAAQRPGGQLSWA
jgi:hypothetical protein